MKKDEPVIRGKKTFMEAIGNIDKHGEDVVPLKPVANPRVEGGTL